MASARVPVDPWDPSSLPFARIWPIYAGIAAGLVLAIGWLVADRPTVTFTPTLVIVGGIAGTIAAALAPAGQRGTRFLDIAYPALVAGVSFRFFGAIGVVAAGNDQGGDAADTALVYFFVLSFFVGFPLLIAKVFQSPNRRLPDDVLAQIDEPYPTRREPRLVTIRTDDGSTHRISVLRGGFVAGIRLPFEIDAVTDVVGDDHKPSGPRGGRSGRPRSPSRSSVAPKPVMPRVGNRAKANTAGGAADDTTATSSPRTPPAPTSRTTPKGTGNAKRRPKR